MKTKALVFLAVLASGFMVFGCENKPEVKVRIKETIVEQSKTMGSVETQVEYLLSQATNSLNSGKYSDAIYVAGYVTSQLDHNSVEANALIEKAQAGLRKIAEEKMRSRKK